MLKKKKTKAKRLWLVLWREGVGARWRIDIQLLGASHYSNKKEAETHAKEEMDSSGYEHIIRSIKVPR